MEAMSLLDLPHEILQSVFEYGGLADLANWKCVCQALNSFVEKNPPLYRQLYLNTLDDPKKIPGNNDPEDWEAEAQKVLRLHQLLRSGRASVKVENFSFIANTICDLLGSAGYNPSEKRKLPSRNIAYLSRMFKNPINVDNILCRSSLFEHAGDETRHIPADTERARQLSAKMHTYYGDPVCAHADDGTETHPYARARVYDLRRYTQGTLWGPFLDDGSQRVDWEKMESIMTDLAYNLKVFYDRIHTIRGGGWSGNAPWAGASPYSYISREPKEIPTSEKAYNPLDELDPYGVSGSWMRVVCFLDYAELFAFNFAAPSPLPDQDRDPIDTEEATRLIGMRLQVTKIEPPGRDDGQALPVVHFFGSSRSLHSAWDPNANSDIRGPCYSGQVDIRDIMLTSKGRVRLTPDGEVRWTTFSIYHGEERWRSEGIQIGGVRSARGVLGNWFDKDYDQHGPAGPTSFWKVCDEFYNDIPRAFQLRER